MCLLFNSCSVISQTICKRKIVKGKSTMDLTNTHQLKMTGATDLPVDHIHKHPNEQQRHRAKLDKISINVQRYSQNRAQNCIFGPPCGGIRGNISTLSESFNAKKLCSRVIDSCYVLARSDYRHHQQAAYCLGYHKNLLNRSSVIYTS